jgi:Tol biopolymer transport system component
MTPDRWARIDQLLDEALEHPWQSQLTDDSFSDRLPRWSPDGKRILYYSNASGRYELWAINPDGSGRRQISFNNGRQPNFNNRTGLVYPALAPDGRWISYCIGGAKPF